jgi:phosphoribosyl-ATP pyrophosphohydrolase
MAKAAPAKRAAKPSKRAPAKLVKAVAKAVASASRVPSGEVLDRLFSVVLERRTASPALSHSARLLSRGTAKVAQKFGEEAVECLIEAVAGNRDALVGESADVLYHLLVMWVAAGVEPAQVWAELHRREGVSGLQEKAARPKVLLGTTKIP